MSKVDGEGADYRISTRTPKISTGEKLSLGLDEQHFETAIEKYGIFPTTVWDINFGDKTLHRLKEKIGDGTRYGSTTRLQKSLRYYHGKHETPAGTQGVVRIRESTFNPLIVIWLLNMFGPASGNIYDPFAGGGARAVVVGKYDLNYYGCEIRREECEAVEARLKENGVDKLCTILNADSRHAPLKDGFCDFSLTCPPYYNLEQYKGGGGDLSMAPSYSSFCAMLGEVIVESRRVLKDGAFSCWVTGLHRDDKGQLIPIPHDVARLHKEAGFEMKEEIVLYLNPWTTGALRRVGMFEQRNKNLVRVHEYCQIFINKK